MAITGDIANALVSPFAFAEGAPAEAALAWLRRNAPLDVVHPDGYAPFWAVVRHADILEVERRSDVFLNSGRPLNLTDMEAERRVREMTGGATALVQTMLQMDAPQHMKYRLLTQSRFMPVNLRALEAKIRETARSFIDHMVALGDRCDFAKDVASRYPLRVIMQLLGVPEADEPQMFRLTQEIFGNADPEVSRSGVERTDNRMDVESLRAAVTEMTTYFNAMTEERRSHPRDDLISVIANGRVDEQLLAPPEAGSYYALIATAGHDTTSSTLAEGLWALAERPDQLKMVKDNPALISGLVEESIRWATPVKHFMRTAADDAQLNGRTVAKGDWLLLSFASGNRDEAVFEDPFAFKVERTPNKHVSFGFGSHVCLGQHLAKMELRVFWEELLPRLEALCLDGEPKRIASAFVCGPKTVPIRFTLN